MPRLALLSTSDKTGLVELAHVLVSEFEFEIVSSGGTATCLAEAGIPVTKVSAYTGSPEILGGRVKTLHPRIHGGILARLTVASDQQDLADNDIRPFDLVVVNLYPFAQTIAQSGVTPTEAIEQIDIGGPTLLRAAAKNHAFVTVLCDPAQYSRYVEEMRTTQSALTLSQAGQPSAGFRAACAQQTFQHTAAYDQAIAAYLGAQLTPPASPFSSPLMLSGTAKQTLRYGENPHQSAIWYQTGSQPSGWTAATQLQGKELSYNNLVDLEAARRILADFPSQQGPAAAILKHTNPCGVALATSLVAAYAQAFQADDISAFGGIVALNQPIDEPTATALAETFLECVVAPACEPEAQAILAKKKNLRVLCLPNWHSGPIQTIRSLAGGFLVQAADDPTENPSEWRIVSQRQPTLAELDELWFAWRVVKHVKSNGIVVSRDRTTIGIGAGQMNRVGAVNIALAQAGDRAPGAALASDGFFPFDDSVRAAAAAGIQMIVQPGGSLRDQDSITAADELGLIMAVTGIRHFLH